MVGYINRFNMKINTIDTIAAIATPLSASGIGIIRISGEKSIEVADKIFKTKIPLKEKESHTISYGHIIDNNEIIDEVLVMLMRNPRSYTGEDTVEINCHGGILIIKKILNIVLKNGARLAQPGEFTKRAFLNQKIDLSKAEAVIDIIEAKNEYALKSSVMHLNGKVREKIEKIREVILNETAFIEAALDDPENYSLTGYNKKLKEIVENTNCEIGKLITTYYRGRLIKEGIDTVIIGKPNAGKSSILNILLNEERAIVTDIEGTTRDTITESINIEGISINITDTAGIRESADIVEKIGVEKAKKLAEKADLILYILDVNNENYDEDKEILKNLDEGKVIIVLNKNDKENLIDKNYINELKKIYNNRLVYFSAIKGDGLDKLINMIKEMFYSGEISFNDELYITSMRHYELLKSAFMSLTCVLASIEDDMPEDFYSVDLIDAYSDLGDILGENVDEDIINQIFSKFCMGK